MAFLTEAANRGSISTGYDINNSLKFEADNTEHLSFANSVGENRRTWTYSTWVKKTELFGAGSVGGTLFGAYLSSNDRARIEQYGDELGLHGKISGTTAVNVRTTRILRDTSAWYHCMVVLDTTQATETDRVKIYVNGVQETSMVSTTYPPQNYQFAINNAVNHFVGQKGDGTDYFCGYMAETYFIDGQALTPTSFGEFDEDSNIWKPKEFSGTYPSADTNHFYLNFDDSSNLGKDSSGNGKNMTSNNIAAADQATDSPTNNFATYNALLTYNSNGKLIEGATKFYNGSGGADTSLSTMAVANGKWYAEFKTPSNVAGGNAMFGVAANSGDSMAGRFLGQDAWSVGLLTDGNYRINNSATSYLGSTWNNTEILSVALDMDNKKVYFAKNGTWGNSGNPANGTNGIALPSAYEDYEWFIGVSLVNYTDTFYASYGGYTIISISTAATDENGYGTFEYAPPTGYYALCTKNLAEYG